MSQDRPYRYTPRVRRPTLFEVTNLDRALRNVGSAVE